MWTSDIDWELFELVTMIASVLGTVVAGFVAMRRDRRADDVIWVELAGIKADLARKADQESIHAIHLDMLKMRMKIEPEAGEEKPDDE